MHLIEQITTDYEHTIAAFATLGTWLAVIAALWIASKSTKPNLNVFVDKQVHIPSKAQSTGQVNWDLCEDVIGVNLNNRGNVPVYINYWSFYWRLPWRWTHTAQQNPLYPDFRKEEITLNPGQSAAITLSNDLEGHKEILREICSKNKVPFFMRMFVSLKVFSSDGRVFKAKFGKSYKREFHWYLMTSDNLNSWATILKSTNSLSEKFGAVLPWAKHWLNRPITLPVGGRILEKIYSMRSYRFANKNKKSEEQ